MPESKIFFREYAIKDDTTLFALHNYICSALAFDPDQMVFFSTYGASGARTGTFGLFDMGSGSMDTVTLAAVAAGDAATIRYYFDMRRKRYFIIELTGTVQDTRIDVPSLLEGKGDDPQQFAEKYIDPEVVAPRKSDFVDDGDDLDDDDLNDDPDNDDEEDGDEDGKLLVDEDFGKEA